MEIGTLIFAIFQILCGIYVILLFGGILKPKEQNDRFDNLKNKSGKVFIGGGVVMILIGVVTLFN